MDDLDVLARDFGFGALGKSKPMRSAQSDRRPIDEPSFSDVFGEPAKFTPSSILHDNSKHSSMGDLDYDSIFSSSESNEARKTNNSSGKTSSGPVYDKPMYDDDIFDGLPGLKSQSASSNVRFDNDVSASVSSPPSSRNRNQNNDFDELLGNLGRREKAGENITSSSAKSSSSSKGFDDLLAGFGSGVSAASNRPITESNWSSVPHGGSKHGSMLDNPFAVSGSASSSTQGLSSSGVFTDPLEEISKHSTSRTARTEPSIVGSRGFNDLDPLNSFGKPVSSFSPGRDKRVKEGSPSGSASPQSATMREQKGNSSFRFSESNVEKRTPVDKFQEPPIFDVPNVSTDFQKSFDQTDSPQYFETRSHVDMSPTSSGPGLQSDDVWLTVSEIPLFTLPTAAPPPSRPPPPIPRRTSRAETGSFSSSSRKKGDEFSPPSNHSQQFQNPSAGPQVSQFDELEDFALGRSQNNVDGSANLHSSEETNVFSAAAASAAAMKEAMEKAEAKFRHAKEVRERQYVKAAKHKESVQLEKDEQDSQEREFRETEERLEHERNQKEEEEREQRRLQKERERSRDIERAMGRQAVERANREVRERASVQARDRAAAESRLKTERASVEKASAEARERAQRVAVQRAQAEARERAAAEAKERAEKAAAAEARDKASVARAEEARRRSERAAVERAGAEVRERAAAEARERAAAATAAKANQQSNDDDLESFFNMGRASSAPKGRANSTNPFSNQQFESKGGSEAGRRASSSSSSSGASSNIKKASSTTNIVDDLSSIFGASPAGEFPDIEGETEERRRARLERHQRTQERAAKALAEKNHRDLQTQREQEERHRIAETLDIEIRRWAAGKEGNLRALLSTLQYVLWPECGWQPVSLTDLITAANVKKAYRKATLCIHPDKVQQKGATLQQKYIAEKVFDLLKEAWNKLNSEELF